MLGPVIVPGISMADLEAVKSIAESAKETANDAMDVIQGIVCTVSVVPSQSGSLVYNGATQSPNWTGYNPEQLTIGGVAGAVAAGSYEATFTPKGDYKWSDGTKTAKKVSWTIKRLSIGTTPAQSGRLTYNGSSQSPSWSGYDSSKMTIGGTTSGTSAGTYKATFTPKTNHQWADGTTTAREVSWVIGKAAGSLTISTANLSISQAVPGTIAVTRSGNGAISASSSDQNIIAVSVSGNTVTVTALGKGSATVTISVAAGTNHNAPASKTCQVTIRPCVFGAKWDGTSTPAWSRTDDAAAFVDPVPYVAGATSYGSPFDKFEPWSGMTEFTLKENDFVRIPRFYYRLSKSGNGLWVQIANEPMDGFVVSPAHMDRLDGRGEREYVGIGRYHCTTYYGHSISGDTPLVNVSFSSARSSIHALDPCFWQMDFAMLFTIWLLYIVEFAHWNSQLKIGYGGGNGSVVQNTGASDAMPYHTGTMKSSRAAYGVGVQYRHIEGLWDNCHDWIDGCFYDNAGLNVVINPSDFKNNSMVVGKPETGFPSSFAVSTSGPFPVFYSVAADGSSSTYSCDGWDYNALEPCLYSGGDYEQSGAYGLFHIGKSVENKRCDYIGCRMQWLTMDYFS